MARPARPSNNQRPLRGSVRVRILPAAISIMMLSMAQDPVAAQSRSESAAHDCAVIADDTRRLDCYDRLFRDDGVRDMAAVAASPVTGTVSPAAAAATAASVGVASAAASAPPTVDPVADFGLTGQQKESRKPREAQQEPLDAIRARVTTAEQDRHGLWRLGLDNGQVWMQTEAALGTRFQPGREVEIRRGSLGSFVLEVPGRPVIRVRRVR